jgi:hypothetical protein
VGAENPGGGKSGGQCGLAGGGVSGYLFPMDLVVVAKNALLHFGVGVG